MVLRLIGYWRSDEHPGCPDVLAAVDPSSDPDRREQVASYLACGTLLRALVAESQCSICQRPNGARELTDGVLAWPEGLTHYVRDHQVRLPTAVEDYIVAARERLNAANPSIDWWERGSPQPPTEGDLPLEPLERLVWAGNVQLVRDSHRRFPQLLIAGDTLRLHVDSARSRQLRTWYEELMAEAGQAELPYAK